MSNICEWVNGEFFGCKEMEKRLRFGRNRSDRPLFAPGTKYCFSCGGYVINTEPKQPVIEKSGETWVARDAHGKNLLCTYPEMTEEMIKQTIETNTFIWNHWKPISEIEITDEIALLRPMVVLNKYKNNNIHELIGIKNNISIHWHPYMMSDSSFTKDVSLATVSDLED